MGQLTQTQAIVKRMVSTVSRTGNGSRLAGLSNSRINNCPLCDGNGYVISYPEYLGIESFVMHDSNSALNALLP